MTLFHDAVREAERWLARKMLGRVPNGGTAGLVDALTAAGWTDREIVFALTMCRLAASSVVDPPDRTAVLP